MDSINDNIKLAVFYTGNDLIYGININKTKAFIITSEIKIIDSPSDSPVVEGIGIIRKEPITLINLDKWLGFKNLPTNEYKLILLCEFNNKKLGLLVKDILNIIEQKTEDIKPFGNINSKITDNTYIDIKDKKELCSIFNTEKLLSDIGFVKK